MSMIYRSLSGYIRRAATGFPALALTGPRQSGKTTLCRELFRGHRYVSLENLDVQRQAQQDPRGFLAGLGEGAILDEVQRVPELFSYLQELLDQPGAPMGRFVLTGSQQFGLKSGITQSLAGRVAMFELPPFTLAELRDRPLPLWEQVLNGFYPPLYDRDLDPQFWLDSYLATYLERDVRHFTRVQDLSTFQRFLRLCAGRCGQQLNLNSLAADAGISQPTAKAWIAILEASYVIYLLPAFHMNFTKRLTKSPKLYFLDTGLACRLLGLRQTQELEQSPFRGPLFENLVVADCVKREMSRSRRPELYHWRDLAGLEVDLLLPAPGGRWSPVEIKSGQTLADDWMKALHRWQDLAQTNAAPARLIHGGEFHGQHRGVTCLPWHALREADWAD